MGYGDEIIASGHAYSVFKKTGKRVVIVGLNGVPRWDEMWNGLDFIVNPYNESFDLYNTDFATIKNGKQCRPYIEYPFTMETGIKFSSWKCSNNVGRIVLNHAELQFAIDNTKYLRSTKPSILCEPNLMEMANQNKQWGLHKWQELVSTTKRDYQWIQVGPWNTRRLADITFIETPTFRHGVAVLSLMRASVLPEGGLAHAAGALHKRAVVLFGGTVDVGVMGYPWHIHMFDSNVGSPCGKWLECGHCKMIWEALQPDKVARKLRLLLEGVLP